MQHQELTALGFKPKMWQFRGESVFAFVAELVQTANVMDFSVARFDGSQLLLIGSFDLSYYHQAELMFADVFYIQLYTPCLQSPRLRYATAEEIARFAHLDMDKDEHLFALSCDSHATNPVYFIGARQVEARNCMVYHYDREDLQPGEEIWEREAW